MRVTPSYVGDQKLFVTARYISEIKHTTTTGLRHRRYSFGSISIIIINDLSTEDSMQS